MAARALVLCIVSICLIAPAKAADQYSAVTKAPVLSAPKPADQLPAFNISIDGSVPGELESNVNHVSKNPTADFSYSPYLKLSALTDLRPNLTYQIYADTSINRYLQYFNNNGSSAGVGTQLTKKWDALQLGAVYGWDQYYSHEFGDFLGTSNDFGLFLRYAYVGPDASYRIKPNLAVTARLDEHLVVQRYLYYFKVDFEHKLVDRWSFIFTPRVRFYDYFGTQSGRHDWVYSASTGLRRSLTEGLNFTTTVGYETRRSDLSGKNYDDWTIQASLDFSYTIFRSGSNAGSDFLQWYSH